MRLAAVLLFTFLTLGINSSIANEELGQVNWLRDYDEAIAKAKKENKQVLILFQEVPGCATCRNYGRNVLSNPLMVEAIEQYFIPLAIFNNKGGKDAAVLKKYNEPSWNNPVVRIVDEKGENVVNRLAGNYSASGLHTSMSEALKKTSTAIDGYFALLGEELHAQKKGTVEESYFKMYCFWSGESHLGKKKGVLSTEPGFMQGHEVVKVKYDKSQLNQEELERYASQANCAKIEKASGYRVDKDPQYYLKRSNYKYLPLSAIQKTKINAALVANVDPNKYLSPKQKLWLKEIESTNKKPEVLYEESFQVAWKAKVEN